MTYLSSINIDGFNKRHLDAFGRIRISGSYTIFDSKQVADTMPLVWSEATKSGAAAASTYSANRASTKIAVSNTTAGRRVRQTIRRFNYQPGKSHLWFMTCIIGTTPAGITKNVGLFDDNNGTFFKFSNSGVDFVIRSSVSGAPVDSVTLRASWTDKMDGTGESGINLDFTKSQILFCDFEWLGVGCVRFGFVVDGVPYYAGQVNNANSVASVYMSTPNLPCRYEIINDGSGPASDLECICATVISEGGQEETGFPGSINKDGTPLFVASSAVLYPLIAMRLRSGYFGSSVKPSTFSINADGTTIYSWYLILNPTVTGTAFSFSALTNYSIEVDKARTNATQLTAGTGTILASGTERDTNTAGGGVDIRMFRDYFLGVQADDTQDILTLAVMKHTGTNINFYCAMNFTDQK